MGWKCIVCNSRSSPREPHVSFHTFPSDANRRAAWLQATGLQKQNINKYSCVCSKHFRSCDFNEDSFPKRTLLPTAVPAPSLRWRAAPQQGSAATQAAVLQVSAPVDEVSYAGELIINAPANEDIKDENDSRDSYPQVDQVPQSSVVDSTNNIASGGRLPECGTQNDRCMNPLELETPRKRSRIVTTTVHYVGDLHLQVEDFVQNEIDQNRRQIAELERRNKALTAKLTSFEEHLQELVDQKILTATEVASILADK